MKPKIALITIRYGINVGGGAETLVRNYAEVLTQKYEVDVITTKAIDHLSWGNHFETDFEIINGVNVRRFGVDFERKMDDEFFKMMGRLNSDESNLELGEKFMKIQGPYSTPMLEFLKKHKSDYKYFIYCPYLYSPTFFGLRITPANKNVLIPAAHDEPFLHFQIIGEEFENLSKVIFLTEEEEDLIMSIYPGFYETTVTGMSINIAKKSLDFKQKNSINYPYIIYVGRIEEGKGVHELIRFFQKYKKENPSDLKLVLVGKSIMTISEDKDIVHLGYLSEEDKIAAIDASKVLILSSQFESFSIVTLEAMKAGKAVLVNGLCQVLKGHMLKSNAGLWYENEHMFVKALDYILKNPDKAKEMGKNGKKYVDLNYSSEIINQKILEFLE